MGNKNKSQQQKSNQVAEHSYHPSDYNSSLEVEQGLATTHEQVSDAYMEGNTDAQIERRNGKNEDIPRKSFEQ